MPSISIATARRLASELADHTTPALEAFASGTRIPNDQALVDLYAEVSILEMFDETAYRYQHDIDRLTEWVLNERKRRGL